MEKGETMNTYIPDVFDFYSNVNELTKGRAYHAERDHGTYIVTLGCSVWYITVADMKKQISDGVFSMAAKKKERKDKHNAVSANE